MKIDMTDIIVNKKYNLQKYSDENKSFERINVNAGQSVFIFKAGTTVISEDDINIDIPVIIEDNVTIIANSDIKLYNVLYIGDNVTIESALKWNDSNWKKEFNTVIIGLNDNVKYINRLQDGVPRIGTNFNINAVGTISIDTNDSRVFSNCTFTSNILKIYSNLADLSFINQSNFKYNELKLTSRAKVPTYINIDDPNLELEIMVNGIADDSKINVKNVRVNSPKYRSIYGCKIGDNVIINCYDNVIITVTSFGKNVSLSSKHMVKVMGIDYLPNDISIDANTFKGECINNLPKTIRYFNAKYMTLGCIDILPKYTFPDACNINDPIDDNMKKISAKSIKSFSPSFPLYANCTLDIGYLYKYDRYFPTYVSGDVNIKMTSIPNSFRLKTGGNLRIDAIDIGDRFAPTVGENLLLKNVCNIGDRFAPKVNGDIDICGTEYINANIFKPKCKKLELRNTEYMDSNIDGLECDIFEASKIKSLYNTKFDKCTIRKMLNLSNAKVSCTHDFVTKYIPFIKLDKYGISSNYKFDPHCDILKICGGQTHKSDAFKILMNTDNVNIIQLVAATSAFERYEDICNDGKFKYINKCIGGSFVSNNDISDIAVINDYVVLIKCLSGKSYALCDGILSEYVNEDKGHDVIKIKDICNGKIQYITYNSKYAAHGNTVKEAHADLIYKTSIRNIDYTKDDIDKKVQIAELYAMYRLITGSCKIGIASFMRSHNLTFESEELYTPRDLIEGNPNIWGDAETSTNVYGMEIFKRFFGIEED